MAGVGQRTTSAVAGRLLSSIAFSCRSSDRRGREARPSRRDIVSDCAHRRSSDRPPRDARRRHAFACRATSPFRIAMPCSPRSPRAAPPSPTTRPAATARRRWRAWPRWASAVETAGIARRCDAPSILITGRGRRGLQAAADALDCGNSGSTMRMLAGVVAAHPFVSTLIGDRSLIPASDAPHHRPLVAHGRRIDAAAAGDRPPLTIHGGDSRASISSPTCRARRSRARCCWRACRRRAERRVTEATPTRDHTERALAAFGAHGGARRPTRVTVDGGQRLHGLDAACRATSRRRPFPPWRRPRWPDPTSTIEGVGLNPSRTGLLDVLRRFGARRRGRANRHVAGRAGRVAFASRARDLGRPGARCPRTCRAVIDELPVLAALATAGGELRVTGAAELRVKESDRITRARDRAARARRGRRRVARRLSHPCAAGG